MLEILAHAAPTIELLASSDEDGFGNLGLILLLAGPAFYALIYFRYRNTHRRHKHEKETEAEVDNLQAGDHFVQRRTGLSNSTMAGANHKDVRGALRKLF